MFIQRKTIKTSASYVFLVQSSVMADAELLSTIHIYEGHSNWQAVPVRTICAGWNMIGRNDP